jgi:hypothetical protein
VRHLLRRRFAGGLYFVNGSRPAPRYLVLAASCACAMPLAEKVNNAPAANVACKVCLIILV